MCGPPESWVIGGWIVGFHYWDFEGRPYGRYVDPSLADSHSLVLDDVQYSINPLNEFPVGYGKAPIYLDGVGDAYVLAGTVGKKISKGMPDGYEEAAKAAQIEIPDVPLEDHSILQPGSAWMLYGPFTPENKPNSLPLSGDYVVSRALNRAVEEEWCPFETLKLTPQSRLTPQSSRSWISLLQAHIPLLNFW
jgi:hypothetical protein